MKKGYIYLFAAALSWAVMAILVKFLAKELTPLWQVFLRILVSATFSFFYLLHQKKNIILKSAKNWPLMIFMGVFTYASSIIAYTFAFNFTTVSNLIFLLSTYPLLTSVLASFFLKERLTRNHIFGLVILLIGIVLIFNPTNIFRYFFGNLLALYVAITFSFYILCSRYFNNKGESPETITFLSIGIGAITAFVMVIFFDKSLYSISLPTLIGVVVFGFLNFTSNILTNIGLNTIPASTGTMILMLEGVFGSILAFFFFSEVPTISFLIGAFLVLLAVYISVQPSRS